MIPPARRDEMDERARFAGKSYKQFDAMLRRLARSKDAKSDENRIADNSPNTPPTLNN